MRWLAICDEGRGAGAARGVPWRSGPELLSTGTLVVEATLAGAPQAPLVLIAQRGTAGWARALTLVLSPDGRLELRQRQGPGRAALALTVPLGPGARLLRISYAWDAPARRSRLSAEVLPGGQPVFAEGRNPLPIPAEDAAALFAPAGAGFRHSALLWMGLSADARAPRLGAAVCGATPIDTPDGPVRADRLRPGDLIVTRDNGARPLISTGCIELPTHGSFTPVRLRAPYFARSHDLIVAPEQHIALSGAEVEYLFGDEEVLVAARGLVNGRSALYEARRPMIDYTMLRLDRNEVIFAADCPVECPAAEDPVALDLPVGPAPTPDAPTLRVLRGYEAVTLQHMRDRVDDPRAA